MICDVSLMLSSSAATGALNRLTAEGAPPLGSLFEAIPPAPSFEAGSPLAAMPARGAKQCAEAQLLAVVEAVIERLRGLREHRQPRGALLARPGSPLQRLDRVVTSLPRPPSGASPAIRPSARRGPYRRGSF